MNATMNSTNKTVTFSNGKTSNVYAKITKAGLRYFYFSTSNGRYMPVSKTDVK